MKRSHQDLRCRSVSRRSVFTELTSSIAVCSSVVQSGGTIADGLTAASTSASSWLAAVITASDWMESKRLRGSRRIPYEQRLREDRSVHGQNMYYIHEHGQTSQTCDMSIVWYDDSALRGIQICHVEHGVTPSIWHTHMPHMAPRMTGALLALNMYSNDGMHSSMAHIMIRVQNVSKVTNNLLMKAECAPLPPLPSPPGRCCSTCGALNFCVSFFSARNPTSSEEAIW